MIENYKSKNLVNKRLFENEPEKDRFFVKFEKAKENYEIQRQKTNKPFLLRKAKLV